MRSLIVAAVLILPLAFGFASREAAHAAGLLVAGFGALGHHLPGVMRVYGDRALFRRFRARLLVAPLVFGAAAFGFASQGLNGISLIVLLWGVWWGALRVYGLLRVEDARSGAAGRFAARLDWFLCVGWFVFGVLHAPARLAEMLGIWYDLGGPLLDPGLFFGFRNAFDVLLFGGTLVFVFRTGRDLLAGRGRRPAQHPARLLAAAMSFGFWWWCSVQAPWAVLGVALFGIFLDAQRLAISRALFQSGRTMLLVYLGLAFGYGIFRFLPDAVSGAAAERGALALVAASTMLHLYFDGFLRRAREPAASTGIPKPHLLRWADLFVLPVVVLLLLESGSGGGVPPGERYRNLTALLPEDAESQRELGVAYRNEGNPAAAEERFRRAVELDPESPRARAHLGISLLARGAWEEAAIHLEAAVRLDGDYAAALHNLGFLRERLGARLDAERLYRQAIEADPLLAAPRLGLARILLMEDNIPEAEQALEGALAVSPAEAEAHRNLGMIRAQRGEHRAAIAHFEVALASAPDDVQALDTAAWILAVSPAARDPERAVVYARRASELAGHRDPSVADTLGAALAAAGDFEGALAAARAARALALDAHSHALAEEISGRIALYEAGRPPE